MKLVYRRAESHDCEWKARAEVLELQLENIRQRAAYDDPGTGLGNSHQLQRDLVKVVARHQRRSAVFSLAIVELREARLPQHRFGREAIVGLAPLLLETARVEDSVYQLSKHRFAVLLPDAPREGAASFVERLRIAVSTVPHEIEGRPTYLLVAGGVAEWLPRMRELSELLAAAESDLEEYKAELVRQRLLFAAS